MGIKIYCNGDVDRLSIDENSDLIDAHKIFIENEYSLSLNGKFDKNFLNEFKFIFSGITQLSFLNWIEADMTFLYSLHNLKDLSIGTVFSEVDFSKLPQLSSLSIPWTKENLKNLSAQKNLTDLAICEFSENDLSALKCFSNILGLSIVNSKSTSLNGIENFTRLKALVIGIFKRLTDISAIENLYNLKFIEFDGCPKMKDFSSLGKLQNLETIYLIDCRNLASIKFIDAMFSLKNLMLMGSTIINDFDLLPAKNLEIVYAHSRKYNINLDEKAIAGGAKGFYQYLK